MITDMVPTGFSSVAAVKLLKTMDSTMETNSSFLATATTTAFDTTSNTTVSGDTMFSIIAAAASAKAAAPTTTQAPASTAAGEAAASIPSDAAAGQAMLASDPDVQKSYTTDQAIDIWYGEGETNAGFHNRSGDNPTGASNGVVIAAYYGLKGAAATSFASAYDNRTLKFSDPNAVISGLNAVVTHTVTTDGEGFPTGETYGETLDESVLSDYCKNNPNLILQTDFAQKSWQGVLITW